MANSRFEVRAIIAALVGTLLLVASAVLAGTDTYTYDQQARLVGVSYADGSTIAYTYDAAGNRLTLSQSAAP